MTKDEMDPQRMLKKIRGEEGEEDGLLPPTHAFSINYEIEQGPRRGQLLSGRFEYTVPNAGKKIEIARLKALYLPQGSAADAEGAILVDMICYLSCTLTSTPKWWKPTQFYDNGVIAEVYKEAASYEARFLGKSTVFLEDAEGVQEEAQDTGAAGADGEGAVDGDVPSSRKRREVLTPHDSGSDGASHAPRSG